MSQVNNTFKSDSEKNIQISKYRKEFTNLDIAIKEDFDYLDTLDLILFEIKNIDYGKNLHNLIHKVNNIYNEFYTNIESLEKSTPLDNILELIKVDYLKEDIKCMICLEKM